MAPLLKLNHQDARHAIKPADIFGLDARSREILTHLRIVALRCRAAARTDLFEACALLSLDGENAKQSFADTLMRCLGATLNRPTTWFRPGVSELSFDEAWLMRCFEKAATGDTANLQFLLRSRVAPHNQRYIGFLIAGISDRFALN